MDLSNYSRRAIHFCDGRVPQLLATAFGTRSGFISLLDIGCGDGALVFGLRAAGLLTSTDRVVGTDLSPLRIERFRKNTGSEGVVSDATDLRRFSDASFDLILCSRVVEHVPNQRAMLGEIHRLLKPRGKLYLSTAFKKWYGWYFYRCNGRWVLDPTHVREYRSKQEVLGLLRESGFVLRRVQVTQLAYSILELVLRLVHRLLNAEDLSTAIARSRVLTFLRRVSIPIIGYRYIEVLCEKSTRGGLS